MSGPRGGLVALSGEADPEDRSDDSEEALAVARPTTGLVARVGLPRPLPRPAGPDSISCQLCILSCGANHCKIDFNFKLHEDHWSLCQQESMESNLVLMIDKLSHQQEMLKPRHRRNLGCLNRQTCRDP